MDLSCGLLQGANRQALENLPLLAEDDPTFSCLLPTATLNPPGSISHFSVTSGPSAQTHLQRGEMTRLHSVSKTPSGSSSPPCYSER